jgi:hypothetical protein
MNGEKELPTIINEKHEIKLYEESRSISTPLTPEIVIFKCPLSCDNCKTIYSNKSTGIKIVCKCSCHDSIIPEVD